MNNKQITVNGYTFQVESTLDDDNCYRLYYGDALVLDDTAYEDYYGDINAVADIMGEQVREETEKPFPWFTLLGAIVEQGSDATKIEDDEDAKIVSVFNYYLDVNDNDEIRFAEYTRKNQQHFLIKPIAKFTVTNVDFDLDNAKVTDANSFEVKLNKKFQGSPSGEFEKDANIRLEEKSWFQQNRSNISFDLIDSTQLKMPTVLARKALLMDEDSNRVRYITSGYQNVYSNWKYKIIGKVPETVDKCLILVTLKFTAYNVEVPYTVYAKYNDREIKFTGTWKGYVIADPESVPPIKTIRYFDMVTGEELFIKAGAKSFKMKRK